MQFFIKLDKEDIVTCKNGLNFLVTAKNGVSIILTEEAADELVADLQRFKAEGNTANQPDPG
jgi:hypothetical protein